MAKNGIFKLESTGLCVIACPLTSVMMGFKVNYPF